MVEKYLVRVGINYPDPADPGRELRAEPGDQVDNLPATAIAPWVEAGVIEPIVEEEG